MARGRSMLKAEITYRDEEAVERTITVADSIIRAVGVGVPLRASAQQAGIGQRTLFDWLAAGREAEGVERPTERQRDLAEFAAAIEKAEGRAIAFNVGVVRQAASKQWTAAAWWLERRYPADFGRRIHVEADEGGRQPAAIEPETVDQMEEAFASAFGDGLPELDPADLLPDEMADG